MLPQSTSQLARVAITNDSQMPGDSVLSQVGLTSPMVPASTTRPVRSCCLRNATTGRSSNTIAFESAPDEVMACLCGPSCLCNGCTKHRPYGDADGTGDANGCGIGCPPDCPSCSNNEDGFVWPSSSIRGPSSDRLRFVSSVGPRPTLPHARGYSGIPDSFFESMSGLDMDEGYDDELDAEGSPDPMYITLPDQGSIQAPSSNSIPQKPTAMDSTINKTSQWNTRI
jgi:hypothetical protein